MRIFLGFLLAGLALGADVWLHSAKLDKPICRGVVYGDGNAIVSSHSTVFNRRGEPAIRVQHATPGLVPVKKDWQDPLAVVLAFAGVGAGVALWPTSERHRSLSWVVVVGRVAVGDERDDRVAIVYVEHELRSFAAIPFGRLVAHVTEGRLAHDVAASS